MPKVEHELAGEWNDSNPMSVRIAASGRSPGSAQMNFDLTTLNLPTTAATAITAAATGFAVALRLRTRGRGARPSLAAITATIFGRYLIAYGASQANPRGRLVRAAARQPTAKLAAPEPDHLSEAEATDLIADLRGVDDAGSHIVDDIAALYLTTIPRSDAMWLKAHFDVDRQGWPTRSLLVEMLAQRATARD